MGADLERQYVDPEIQERYYREQYAPIVPAALRQAARTVRLLEAFRPGGTLLDLGCGAGVVAAAAAARGWLAIGYDVSPVAARWGRKLLGTDIVGNWGDVVDSPLAPFDAVAAIEVVEHVDRPLELLRRGLSALKPGGILVVSTPNLDSLARLRHGRRWSAILPDQHILYLNPRSLRRLLLRAGAEPLRVLTWSSEIARLPVPGAWLRWLRDPPGGHALLALARRRSGRER